MDIWAGQIPGARFLDLFAGSGAVGIEAASRGAGEVTLVESDPTSLRQLANTCRQLELTEVRIVAADLPRALADPRSAIKGPFDLVFADPPYAFDGYDALLAAAGSVLAPDGELAVEHERRRSLPEESETLLLSELRQYGDSSLSIYRART